MSAAFDRLTGMPTFEKLPIRMEQTTSTGATVLRLVLLSPALVLLAVPMLIGAHVAGEPDARLAIAEHPMAALQVLVGFLFWAGLLAIPLGQAIRRMGARRTVEIDAGTVRVTDRTLGGTRTWSAPLASYRGIAHHVRTSMSGVRHELILVGSESSRNVLLAFQDRMSEATLEKAKALLGLPEVSARTIYQRVRPAPSSATASGLLAGARG